MTLWVWSRTLQELGPGLETFILHTSGSFFTLRTSVSLSVWTMAGSRGVAQAPSGARLPRPSQRLPACSLELPLLSSACRGSRVSKLPHMAGPGRELSRSMVCWELVVLPPGTLRLGSAHGMELCSPVSPDPARCPATPLVLNRYWLMRVCMRARNRFSRV